MKKLILVGLIASLLFGETKFTTRNGKLIRIPDPIGFTATIKSVTPIGNYTLVEMYDEEDNIIRGRFIKDVDLERNQKRYIQCNTYNNFEYEHCYKSF